MKKGKNRHNPEKSQNNYGGDYDCPNFDNLANGKEFCHNEGFAGWKGSVFWAKTDENNKLICKGNLHRCNKMRLKWYASLSDKEKEKYKRHLKGEWIKE